MKRQCIANEFCLSDCMKLNFPNYDAKVYLTNITMKELYCNLSCCKLSFDNVFTDTIYFSKIYTYNKLKQSTYIMIPSIVISKEVIEILEQNEISVYIHFEWKEKKPENVYLMIK